MSRLPSLFAPHGAPTFALDPGVAGPRLTKLGRSLHRPQAVLVISPHPLAAALLLILRECMQHLGYCGLVPSRR